MKYVQDPPLCYAAFGEGATLTGSSSLFLRSDSETYLLLATTSHSFSYRPPAFPSDHTAIREQSLKMGSLLEPKEPKSTYLVGINVLHTIAPPMHDHVAQKVLHLPWTFTPQECPTVDTAMTLFRQPDFAGGLVTMPYKKSIMPRLDKLDDLCKIIGACNCVYLASDETGKKILRGTNTDWRGIKGCLTWADPASAGLGKPALIIGAGGASRAAVYALSVDLNCSPIYVINRDDGEVMELLSDVRNVTSVRAQSSPDIIHIKSPEQAMSLASPYYIVGTTPDFEPITPDEIKARKILTAFLEKAEVRGVFLDMCYKPRVTRQIKLATRTGWTTVEGTGIIGHQIHENYRLWAGADLSEEEQESAWEVLREKAESSPGINF